MSGLRDVLRAAQPGGVLGPPAGPAAPRSGGRPPARRPARRDPPPADPTAADAAAHPAVARPPPAGAPQAPGRGLGIAQPPGGTATDVEGALAVAKDVGYPVLVRPSYVLGGRAMQIVHDEADLRRAMAELSAAGSLGREGGLSAERPVLVDRF